ncbi:branched-chain alpha-ketoacid dehydrogenase, partial [Zychaea mexicana]|uniref:branched-chain alpha-ketoacid dehydrogenase n=1 Tax=Zychaea mexicana TaxID=64656 RepID=UPI0022FE0819
ILEEYVRRPANASTLRQYIFYGRQMTSDRLITAANWVRNELLTRLAHRIRDFQQLPFFVGMNPHIEFVYRLYWGAFEKLRKQPAIKTLDDNEDFCKCLEDLLDDGQLVVPKLALGITECARHYSGSQDLDRFMNRMLRSRISRRMLAEQHLALTEAHEHGWDMMGEGADGYVGIIFVRCSASDLVSQATRLVRRHAETIYAKPENSSRTPPAIRVNIHQDTQQGLQQVPEHLEYILFELLSNAVRFTMAAWEKQPENPYPPVQLTVSANETDVYFRVTDQGKGIAPDVYKHLWSYQARAPSGQFHHFHQVQKMPSSISERATQAADLGQTHLGMGLTMSRILAEYWGGELQVMTMEGFGTDAYVRIPRLGTKAENL